MQKKIGSEGRHIEIPNKISITSPVVSEAFLYPFPFWKLGFGYFKLSSVGFL
jgi:hypothetical protein